MFHDPNIGELVSCYLEEIINSLLVCISNLSSVVVGCVGT